MKISSPANASSRFSWTAGSYFFYQNNPSKQAIHYGKDAGIFNLPDIDFSTINTSTAKNTGIALYVQTNYLLTNKLSLVAGLRYDFEHRNLRVKGEYQKDGTDAFIITPDTAASVNYSAVSPKLGIQWVLAKNTNLFANYSRGFRTGSLTQLSSDPRLPPLYPYQPEYSNNIELDIKNNFLNNRLHLNFTVFFTRINNAQVPTLILPDAITVTRNTGELKSTGAELELLYAPVKGLQIGYNFGYTHAKFTSLKISSDGNMINLAGKRQLFTPDVTSVFTLQYNYLLSAKHKVKLVAGGEWFYLGQQYFD